MFKDSPLRLRNNKTVPRPNQESKTKKKQQLRIILICHHIHRHQNLYTKCIHFSSLCYSPSYHQELVQQITEEEVNSQNDVKD
ncbi:hypothetical protein BpHYR1_013023 [Brachionus plicatilis]|uniref:Uncharacterized protein n=1 Tax=Brachionus plicatilis TaxID=10195 RepID=A0A3M7R1R2_BRAPC|nr:hypothetical protein BpHYR1_013023 [Brachionus plicatilis]